jgi:hypothetical protein
MIFIRDGLHLSFGHFQSKSELSHYEIERGYNIFGQPIETMRPNKLYYRILRNGDGIKTFKTEQELNLFLSQFDKYDLFNIDLIHKKFYDDRNTLLELSNQ